MRQNTKTDTAEIVKVQEDSVERKTVEKKEVRILVLHTEREFNTSTVVVRSLVPRRYMKDHLGNPAR